METIYQKIVDTFESDKAKAVFAAMEIQEIRQIDIHMGQPDNPQEWEMFLPAMFIAWSVTPGTTESPDILTMEFHILQEPGAGTESFSDRITEGLKYVKLLKAVKKCLNQLSADNTSPFKYAGERPAVTEFYRYHILSYNCAIDSFTETINRPELTTSTVEAIDITGGILRTHVDDPETPEIETYK